MQFKKAMELLRSGRTVSVSVCKYDAARKSGGDIKHIARAKMGAQRYLLDSQNKIDLYDCDEARHVRVHTRAILRLDGKRVV